MTPSLQPLPARSDSSASTDASEPRRIESHALLRGGRRLIIDHRGDSYTLLLTRNDKLILTK